MARIVALRLPALHIPAPYIPALRILPPLASLVLFLVLLAPGCRCSRSSADDAGLAALPEAASGVASGSATLGDARPGVTANASFPELEAFARATPAWTVQVPSEPGLRVIERSVGPVMADNVVLVGSSAIGVAALELETGAIRWQRRGEHAPELPSVAGDELWLAGRCLGQDISAGATACIELVDLRSGALLERAWVDAAALPPPSEERRVLGAWPRLDGSLELLWAGGAEVIAIDPRRPRAGWSRYGAAGAVGERVYAALAEPDALTVIGSSGIAGFARAIPAVPGAGQVGAPRWQRAYERAPGAAGPVRVPGRADDLLIMVHDDALIGLAGATEVWRTGGIYAYAPGSVAVLAEERALAVRMDGGLRPVVVDTRTGAVIEEWQHGPGIQVLAAVMVDAGMVMAVRLDSSLRRDAIIAYDASGRIIWAYALPMPQRRRVEPVGLAGAAGGLVGFHDARSVIWLPAP